MMKKTNKKHEKWIFQKPRVVGCRGNFSWDVMVISG